MSTEMNNDDNDHCESDDSESVWFTLFLAGSSALLGYLMGRVSYSRDLGEAMRRANESAEPIDVVIRTL